MGAEMAEGRRALAFDLHAVGALLGFVGLSRSCSIWAATSAAHISTWRRSNPGGRS